MAKIALILDSWLLPTGLLALCSLVPSLIDHLVFCPLVFATKSLISAIEILSNV